ncbi:MAG: hypothetical protein L3J95_03410 [Thermoplasmata archaeon]|nr:hypothetical protein [Thermoplasmata archaeon]MCI4359455.1 hypothetical protein [Thermoplasmata archaeon]
MRFARGSRPADRFLGVRLTHEELEQLDRHGGAIGSSNRSETVRALVRGAQGPTHDQVELPPSLREQLNVLVEDGWAPDEGAALTAVLTLGLQEFARTHAERIPNLRQAARDGAERRKARRAADREGRGLLDR